MENNTHVKLSNILLDNNFQEFYDKCNSELRLESYVQDELEDLMERYELVTEIKPFIPKENRELSIDIIDFCLSNFAYFKNMFNYSIEEVLDICPGLILENFGFIYDQLMDGYEINY